MLPAAALHDRAIHIYYHCSTNCQKEKYVRQERLVELFGQVVKELQLGPELLEIAKRVLLESRETIKEDAAARMAAQRQRYDRYGALIDKAYVDKLEGRITEDFFQDKRREWEAERTAAMDLMQRLARADRDNLDLGIQVLELSDQAYDLYSQRTPHEQRLLLDLLCSNSEVGGGQLEVGLRKPFCYLRNMAQEARNETAPSRDSEGGRPMWWAILDEVRTLATAHERWEDGVLERFRGVVGGSMLRVGLVRVRRERRFRIEALSCRQGMLAVAFGHRRPGAAAAPDGRHGGW